MAVVKTSVTGLPPDALSKITAQASKAGAHAGEQLIRTATYSVSDSIAKWATASIVPLRRDIEKALQPFMKAIQQQVVQSLGSMSVPKVTIAAPTVVHAPSPASIPAQATTGGMTQAQFYALPGGQKAPAYKATNIPPPGGIGPYAPTAGPGGQGWNPGGPSTGGLPRPAAMPAMRPAAAEKGESAFGVAMMTEGINSIFEQISDVRNEMYATAIQSSNLQRQLNFAPSRDIRPFMNQMSTPGMELGYTRQEALGAAQTLALSGGRQTQAQVVAANRAMVEFASQRGLQLPDWAGIAAGGEQAGLFGGARGTEGGAEGIEGYQRRLAGAYAIAARPGQGSRGTTLEFQDFAQSINSLTEGLTQITGNSQEVAESFKDIGKSGNLFNLFTRLQQTSNQAVAGQAGVQAITGMAASVTNQVFGTPMQQSMAYSTFPGKSLGDTLKEEYYHPGEAISKEVGAIKQQYKGSNQEVALMKLFPNLNYGQAEAVLKATGGKGGKDLSDKELQKLGIKPGGPDQATDYRTAMDALTKKMEELATSMSPLLMTFDKLQGVSYGLLGVWMLMQREKFAESLAHVGKLFGFGGGKKGTVAEGVGEAIASKLDCVKICNGSELGQQLGQGLKKEAEAKVEGAAEGEAEQVAKQGLFRRLLGQGSAVFRRSAARIAGGEGIAAVGGDVLGGLGASAAGAGEGLLGAAGVGLLGAGELAAGVAASPLLLPAAVVGGGLAAAYGITHPKQAADFIGGVGHFAGQAIGGTVNAAGNVIGGTANALWKTASAITTLAVGKDAADAIGGFGKKLASPFNWAGSGIKNLWHGAEHFGSGAESTVGDFLKHTGFAVNRMFAHGGGLLGLASSIANPFQTANEVQQALKGWHEADPKHTDHKHKEAVGGVIGVEVARHLKDTTKIRLDHLKATNEQVEKLVKTHLDKNNPLPPQSKADFLTSEGNFLKNIGDTLKGWFKGAWDTVSGWFSNLVGKGTTGGGGNGGGGGGGGSDPIAMGGQWQSGKGGKGSQAQFLRAVGGSDFSQVYGQNNEQGVDVTIGAGSNAKLPIGGKFLAQQSTAYSAVFDIGGGKYMWIDHVDTAKLKDGQYYGAGSTIGKVSAYTNTNLPPNKNSLSFTDASGKNTLHFTSTGAHLEYGIASSASNAEGSQSGIGDPRDFLESATAGGTQLVGGNKSSIVASASNAQAAKWSIYSPPSGAPKGWEADILKKMKAPVTKGNVLFLDAWAQIENTNAGFNPFASTLHESGSTQFNSSADVQNYSNWKTGLNATVSTLGIDYYTGIVNQLRKGSIKPGQKISDPGFLKWSGGSYGSVDVPQGAPIGGVIGIDPAHGGVQALKVEPIEVTVNLKFPDGSIQKIVQTAKFQGVGGVHVAVPGHGLSSHHANSRVPRK